VQLFEQVSPAMAKAQAVLPLECAKQIASPDVVEIGIGREAATGRVR
jgi:hypothetical protein